LSQRELADAVGVPVLASGLIQASMTHNMRGSGRGVGVLTAGASSLSKARLAAVGAGDVPVGASP
jgi:hypothetical protein